MVVTEMGSMFPQHHSRRYLDRRFIGALLQRCNNAVIVEYVFCCTVVLNGDVPAPHWR
jgi:hypothetical protein